MSECLRCGRDLIDPNAKYGWRCAEKVGTPYGKDVNFADYFPEFKKQYDFLSNDKKKKFDEYLENMLKKLKNEHTAIEGAGMYLTISSELKKDAKKNLEYFETLKRIIELEKNRSNTLNNETGKITTPNKYKNTNSFEKTTKKTNYKNEIIKDVDGVAIITTTI
jgi:hypothetical protein